MYCISPSKVTGTLIIHFHLSLNKVLICNVLHSPFLPNVGMVKDADLVMLSPTIAARDQELAF